MDAASTQGIITSAEIFDAVYQFLKWLLLSFGYYKIFEKCAVNKKWAFVPLVREYKLGVCADREYEARIYTILTLASALIRLARYFFDPESLSYALLGILMLSCMIGQLVYSIRIILGLIQIFGRRKRWLFMFILFETPTTLYWGFSSKFQPLKKMGLKEMTVESSDAHLQDIADGLTVNITDRTVTDFFRKKALLKDIHMTIPKGHMVLLLGGSGAGKTTFLNAVTGYEKANASIQLRENDLYKDYEKVKYDVGFVPQQDLMRGSDTVLLTLSDAAMMRLPADVSFTERRKRVQAVLDEFGLAAIKNSLVDKLSGGQRKRLSIAMEYISNPTLFILDEPDSGLDGVVAKGLFKKLRSIADTGKIVIVITHTPDRVIDLFDDVIVLAKDSSRTGRLAYYGSVENARKFFRKDTMEEILLSINQKEEGGEGRTDEFIMKCAKALKKDTNRKAG